MTSNTPYTPHFVLISETLLSDEEQVREARKRIPWVSSLTDEEILQRMKNQSNH